MSKFKSANFDAYAAAIRQRESSGDYTRVNDGGYTGAYQFGKSALIDAGFMDRSGNWTSYAQSLGINSMEDFKNNPEAQDTAFQNLTKKNWDYLRNYLPYVGKTIGGVPITVSGLLAGAHLVGQGDVKKFLDSNGTIVPVDGNGTPVTEYMKKFGGYDFKFDNNRKGFGGVVETRPEAIPYLAQTQAIDPAFGATQWLQRPASPNVLQPDAASPFAPSVGTPKYAATPYTDETRRAQQVLDTLPHAPSAMPQPHPTMSPARSAQLQPTRPGIRAPLSTTPQSPELSLRPLVPPASSRSYGPAAPSVPAADPLPPLHFAPEPLGFAGGVPGMSASTVSPAASGIARPPSTGNAVWDWRNGLVAADAVSRRNGFGGLNIPMPNNVPTPPTQTVLEGGLPGMLQRAGAFDPPAGGLLRLLQEHMRNNPDDDVSA